MSLVRVQARFTRYFRQNSRHLATGVVPVREEYVLEPQYPKIQDLSFHAKMYRKKEMWHEKLQKVGTVEEKLIGINMPRYYGYKCVMLSDQKFPYNCLALNQYCTRTVFHEVEKLPEFYRRHDEAVERIANTVKSVIEESLVYELRGYTRTHDARNQEIEERQELDIVASAIVREVNRILLNSLSGEFSHLEQVDVDLSPRHEAFWAVGGMKPPLNVQKSRDGLQWSKKYKDVPVDRFFQYRGTPYVALRHQDPLQPLTDAEASPGDVPQFLFDPHTIGYTTDHCQGTCIPGFWPGEPREFGTLSYQSRSHFLVRRGSYGAQDEQEALHAQGITSSYAWLLAQAAYQGFSTYNELTYPLVAQTVVTDGQKWSFYAYQLNTLLMHSHHAEQSPKTNECWGTREEKLFEGVDESGKLVGFNDNVLKHLIAFYCNAPAKRQEEMKPFLSAEKHLAGIEDAEKRQWLEERFKHYMSNRPRHHQMPEIFQWEKIYMIDHDKRPMDARRKFWQLNVNPFKRRLNEHMPRYIPKPLRPGGPKSKDKFVKEHYPDC